jgi:hypothetical protein
MAEAQAAMGTRRAARRRCVADTIFVAALTGLTALTGCALAANPQPPTLWLPDPVKDLAATRVGDSIHLHWTMPKETTDKVVLKTEQQGHFCWQPAESAPGKTDSGFDAKKCHGAGDGKFTPDKPADFTLQLPAELTNGTPQAVAVYLQLQNHAGKSAGPSNAAWVASGAPPDGVTGLQLETHAEGVVLRWHPAETEPGLVMRIHRELVSAPKPDANAPRPDESKGAPPVEEQTLEVDLDKPGTSSASPSEDQGVALDRDALLDHTWKYWAERVAKSNINGHALEFAGPPSAKVSIDAKDIFPPAVPADLAVVADAQGKAMDISWSPDSDADIAGYIVYRRDLTAASPVEPITKKPLIPPSYADATVVPGHRYAYAVSAVDQDGNESAKSAEVEEEMPQ